MEANEDKLACLRRELKEETGLSQFEIGPLIWTRQLTFSWGGRLIAQEESYYLVETQQFNPVMVNNPSEVEAASFRGFRWWTPEEIDASSELFAPRLLGAYLRELLDVGPPAQPIDVGV